MEKAEIEANFETYLKPENKMKLQNQLVMINMMETYTDNMNWYPEKTKKDFEAIDQRLVKLSGFDYKERIKRQYECVATNQKFCTELAKTYKLPEKYYKDVDIKNITEIAYNKQATIDNELFYYIMRDWTDEREVDRKKQYDVIMEDLKKYLSVPKGKILIPGAGVCRLAYDILNEGHDVDCNDYEVFNYMATDYLLTKAKKYQFEICPNYSCASNFMKEEDLFKAYKFPNIETGLNKPNQGKMKFILGDFNNIFDNVSDSYDAVITVYFIDSAFNILKYIEIIQRVLKKGGIWINYGPPTYDWQRSALALSWDVQKEAMKNYGLEIIKEEFNWNCYCCTTEKIVNTNNYCVIFTAVKK